MAEDESINIVPNVRMDTLHMICVGVLSIYYFVSQILDWSLMNLPSNLLHQCMSVALCLCTLDSGKNLLEVPNIQPFVKYISLNILEYCSKKGCKGHRGRAFVLIKLIVY